MEKELSGTNKIGKIIECVLVKIIKVVIYGLILLSMIVLGEIVFGILFLVGSFFFPPYHNMPMAQFGAFVVALPLIILIFALNRIKAGYDRKNVKKGQKIIRCIRNVLIIIACVVWGGITWLLYDGGEKRYDSGIKDRLGIAKQYMDEQQYHKVLEEYEKVLAAKPDNVKAYLTIIEIYIKYGDYEKAAEYAEKGYAITGDDRLQEKADMIDQLVADLKGNFHKELHLGYNGRLLYWNVYTYNSDNKKETITVFSGYGEQIDQGKYQYNGAGNMVKDYYNGTEGYPEGCLTRVEMDYDELGRVSIRAEYPYLGGKNSSVYLYKDGDENCYGINYKDYASDDGSEYFARDDEGRITECKRYDRYGHIGSSETRTYDASGNEIRTDYIYYNWSGEVRSHSYSVREYSENGEELSEKRYDKNGNITYEVVYEYNESGE
ncbi:MAG: tetratricopeptide repeat protein, partial [Lachnospiraceae bacterium]|nr:tetratricopeptide repeat protein [Lachnospiraceae bacterium]